MWKIFKKRMKNMSKMTRPMITREFFIIKNVSCVSSKKPADALAGIELTIGRKMNADAMKPQNPSNPTRSVDGTRSLCIRCCSRADLPAARKCAKSLAAIARMRASGEALTGGVPVPLTVATATSANEHMMMPMAISWCGRRSS